MKKKKEDDILEVLPDYESFFDMFSPNYITRIVDELYSCFDGMFDRSVLIGYVFYVAFFKYLRYKSLNGEEKENE